MMSCFDRLLSRFCQRAGGGMLGKDFET